MSEGWNSIAELTLLVGRQERHPACKNILLQESPKAVINEPQSNLDCSLHCEPSLMYSVLQKNRLVKED